MTLHRTLSMLATAAALSLTVAATPALAAETPQPPRQVWSFSGPFGKYDQAQLQRGFKVFKEVCASCHGMSLVSFRNLAEPGGLGYTPAQAQAIATGYQIQDGPNDSGDMFERPGRLADRFPSPFPNDNAARAANGGTVPPDFSVLAKARTYERGFPWFVFDIFTLYQEQGPDYIHALLMGYEEAPQGFALPEGAHYNKYFPGHAIAMPQPITADQVTYDDGTPTTIDQYGKDVAAFMMWAAEPHMIARKRLGLQVMLFLLLLTGLLYFTKKKVWSSVEGHA
jgi:ubiquinol-cytochrome c reductase cytochrome b/c1 subunit